eukprot:9476973-Lingulodinium_polyedra.AAC.1
MACETEYGCTSTRWQTLAHSVAVRGPWPAVAGPILVAKRHDADAAGAAASPPAWGRPVPLCSVPGLC